MAWRYPPFTRRTIKGLIALSVIVFLLHSFQLLDFSSRRYDIWAWTACPGSSPFEPSCTAPRASITRDVQIVVKTGGSEPQSRLRSQLATLLSKVPRQNVLIFSDLEEHLGPYRVHDVYADLSEKERASYPEFALYDAQQEYQKQGKDTRELQGGWDLAKYMNLAMKRKIWAMQQETGNEHLATRKWFVFIDTDTFIEWDNLLELLGHLDPAEKIYIGSPVWLPKLQFAHGGSAYVLSHGALKALNKPSPQDRNGAAAAAALYSQFGLNVTTLCCGDEALARVLKPKGVSLKGYWPMFNGEIPATVPFAKDIWCEPVISLHHLDGEAMQSFWKWVEDWKTQTKSKYISAQFTDVLPDWDNTDDDMKIFPTNKASHKSFDSCKAACRADKSCFQFVHDGAVCALSYQIRLGRKRSPPSPPEKGGGEGARRRYVSGWDLERIREWTAGNECAGGAHWVRSNP